jgi:hypothetical protein
MIRKANGISMSCRGESAGASILSSQRLDAEYDDMANMGNVLLGVDVSRHTSLSTLS